VFLGRSKCPRHECRFGLERYALGNFGTLDPWERDYPNWRIDVVSGYRVYFMVRRLSRPCAVWRWGPRPVSGRTFAAPESTSPTTEEADA